MYTVPMALLDFVPVVFFIAASYLMLKDLYNKMSKGAYAMLCAGLFNVSTAGGAKALYKLLYALGICDFQALSAIFFPIQAFGFLLAGIAMVCLVSRRQGKGRLYAVVPPFFSGTMIFVGFMVLGLGGMDTGLSVIARRMKQNKAVPMFIVSFVCSLMMGYLSSKDFSKAYMNYIGELVNTVGQACLFLGMRTLDHAGLEDFQME